jgi:transposase
MSHFITGEDRTQTTLFPASFDDYISDNNPVRMVDYFVDDLNLAALGFNRVNPASTGRPAYHPSVLLKIYIYGYLNRIQSSRRLERESQRNIELMWLTGRLAPDFKTIADFRKDNGKAIRKVCAEFVSLCRQMNLFSQTIVAIDGSKFKAVNNRDNNFTSAKMKRRLEEVEKKISSYLADLDEADQGEPDVTEAETEKLQEKITALKEKKLRLKKLEAQMLEAPDKQVSLTDPDCRSMRTRGTGIVGYNVQTAVDVKHHLIPVHDVTNNGSDRGQLHSMADKARTAMGSETLEVLADAGYYNGKEIVACEENKITTSVPKPQTSGSKAEGRFGKQDFQYIPQNDEYLCPAGQRLTNRFISVENEMNLNVYFSSACRDCQIREQCTTGKARRIKRWEHEDVLDAMQERLKNNPDKMLIRKQTVEHPYGTIKDWMGATHFLMKTLEHVSTEMSLHVLAYNMKRVMNIMGVRAMMEAMQA